MHVSKTTQNLSQTHPAYDKSVICFEVDTVAVYYIYRKQLEFLTKGGIISSRDLSNLNPEQTTICHK